MSLKRINKLNKNFDKVVNMLIDAMKIDMDMAHAGGQSTMDMHRLKDVNLGLKAVGACRDIIKDCYMLLRDTVGSTEEHKNIWVSHDNPDEDESISSEGGPNTGSSMTAMELAKTIVEIAESPWVDTETFASLATRANVPPGEVKVDFTQRILALFKRLPPNIIDNETREKVIEAGQEYLDQAIDEEEEMLEE